MTTLLDSSPLSVVEALRGDRSKRPLIDIASAGGLRSLLEDGIFDDRRRASSRRNRSSFEPRRCTGPSTPRTSAASASGRIRGILIGQLLRLLSVGMSIDHAFDDAVAAWRGDVGDHELIQRLDALDDDERARLATDLDAHFVTLTRALGEIPARWMPRSSVRAIQRLAGGNVVLRDVVDLMIGTSTSDVASIALFDVTTSPLGEGAERSMRYHALMQTLRTSVMPLRTCTFSSATGEIWIRDVDYELLARSVDDVLATVAQPVEYSMTLLHRRLTKIDLNELVAAAPSEPVQLTDEHRAVAVARAFAPSPSRDIVDSTPGVWSAPDGAGRLPVVAQHRSTGTRQRVASPIGDPTALRARRRARRVGRPDVARRVGLFEKRLALALAGLGASSGHRPGHRRSRELGDAAPGDLCVARDPLGGRDERRLLRRRLGAHDAARSTGPDRYPTRRRERSSACAAARRARARDPDCAPISRSKHWPTARE